MLRLVVILALLLAWPSSAIAISSSTWKPAASHDRCTYNIAVEDIAGDAGCWTGPMQDQLDCAARVAVQAYNVLNGMMNERPTSGFSTRACLPVMTTEMSTSGWVAGHQVTTHYYRHRPLLEAILARQPDVRVTIHGRADVWARPNGDETAIVRTSESPLETSGSPSAGGFGCPPGSPSHDAERSAAPGSGGAVCNLGGARMCAGGPQATEPCFLNAHCPDSTCEVVELDPAWLLRVPAGTVGAHAGAWPIPPVLSGGVRSGTSKSLLCGVFPFANENCSDPAAMKALLTLEPFVSEESEPVPYSSSTSPNSANVGGVLADIRNEDYQNWIVADAFERACAYGYGDGCADPENDPFGFRATGKHLYIGQWTKWATLPYYDAATDVVTDPPHCAGHPTYKWWWLPAYLKAGARFENFQLNALSREPDPGYEWRAGLPDCEGTPAGPYVYVHAGDLYEVELAVAEMERKLIRAILRPGSPLPEAGLRPSESTRWRDIHGASCGFKSDVCSWERTLGVRRRANITRLSSALTQLAGRSNPPPSEYPPAIEPTSDPEPEPNESPVAVAGGPYTITVPDTSVAVDCSASTDDGLPDPPGELTYLWTITDGGGEDEPCEGASFVDPTAAETTLEGVEGIGSCTIECEVTDGDIVAEAATGVTRMEDPIVETTIEADFTLTAATSPCPAPCAVHVDALGNGEDRTVDSAVDVNSRIFHTHRFSWDFGDPGQGSWPRGALRTDRNEEHGPLAAHLFRPTSYPDTCGGLACKIYTITLEVASPTGATDTVQRTQEVLDPDAYWPTTDTVCVCPDGGCPTWCTTHGATISTAAANTGLTSDCGVNNPGVGKKRRCLFEGGNSTPYDLTSQVSFRGLASNGVGLVGTIPGTGRASFRTTAAGSYVFRIGTASDPWEDTDGWIFDGLDFTTAGGAPSTQHGLFEARQDASGIVAADIVATEFSQGCWLGQSGGEFHKTRHFLFDSVFVGQFFVGTGETSGCRVFWNAGTGAMVAVEIDQAGEHAFNMRSVHGPKMVWAHNYLHSPRSRENSSGDYNVWTMRAWANVANLQNGSGALGPAEDRWVVIRGNEFRQETESWILRTCLNNECTSALRACQPPGPNNTQCTDDTPCGSGTCELVNQSNSRDVLIESNLLALQNITEWDPTTGNAPFTLEGGDITVRSNVVDLTGRPSGSITLVTRANTTGDGLAHFEILLDRLQVHGNTWYQPGLGSSAATFCGFSSAGTGHRCDSNLAVLPGHTGSNTAASGTGGSTPTGNVWVRGSEDSPFVDAIPAIGLSVLGDFAIDEGSTPIDAGFDYSEDPSIGGLYDVLGNCRPFGPGWDAGAFEFGASPCP